MAGKKPEWKVLVSRESNDKNYYTQVGAGWNVKNDGISVLLHCLPTDGKLVLFPNKDE